MEYMVGMEAGEEKKAYKSKQAAYAYAEKNKMAVYAEDGEILEDYREPEADPEEVEQETAPEETVPEETDPEEADPEGTEQESQEEELDGVKAIRCKGKIRQIFDGSLRLRKYPSWHNEAVAGAVRFEEKEVTHVLDVKGEKMYRTADGYYITGDPELVEYVEE